MSARSGYEVGVDAPGDRVALSGSARGGYGWVVFAALMLTVAGTFGVIDGIVALTRSEFFRPTAQYVFADLDTWAWLFIIGGTLQLAAGAALGTGLSLARWYGIAAACANALVQLLAVQAYPFWSISMFALDVLVVYALAVHVADLRDR